MYQSRSPVACPDCGERVHISYADRARQLGNWELHDTPQGQRCKRSLKKAIASKYRGL